MTTYVANRVRHKHDQYFTPAAAVRPVLPELDAWLSRPGVLVLEPTVGEGGVLGPVLDHASHARSLGIDIDADVLPAALRRCPRMVPVHGSYLDLDLPAAGIVPDVIVGNPPYDGQLQPIVEKALREVAADGVVAFLLRLNWLETPGRAPLHSRRRARLVVLSRRPSFTGDGRTDGQAYAWFVWLPIGHALEGTWRVGS